LILPENICFTYRLSHAIETKQGFIYLIPFEFGPLTAA